MIRVGIVGLGKMGLSHHALFNAHPDVEVGGVCDSSSYVRSVLAKYTGASPYGDFETMLDVAGLDAVVVATPSRTHTPMVEAALDRDLHVFCEKPLTLNPGDAERLASVAAARGLVTQVGYHNRFVATFQEVKSLLEAGAIGTVTHVLGEAYGPVVLKPKSGTWRSRPEEGGGCLYDYAAHVIDLITWYMGEPAGVGGSVLSRTFSSQTDDAAFSTLYFGDNRTGQISVNWSDESQRKMTTRVGIWGSGGRILADRQECQVYLRSGGEAPEGYELGWNVRYTTDLTKPVWFYLRGEEYSAQVEHFVDRVAAGEPGSGGTGFASAALTDRTISMIAEDAEAGPSRRDVAAPGPRRRGRRLFGRRA